MNKTKKNFILALVSLFVLMVTAASVSADDEPNLIAPSPGTDEEPNLIAPNPVTDEEPNLITPISGTDEEQLIIAPNNVKENQDALSKGNDFASGLILVIVIAGIASLAAALILFKKKN